MCDFSNCAGVIIPRDGAEIIGHEQEFCPRCECKYENRNTTIIKVCLFDWLQSKDFFAFLCIFSFDGIYTLYPTNTPQNRPSDLIIFFYFTGGGDNSYLGHNVACSVHGLPDLS